MFLSLLPIFFDKVFFVDILLHFLGYKKIDINLGLLLKIIIRVYIFFLILAHSYIVYMLSKVRWELDALLN